MCFNTKALCNINPCWIVLFLLLFSGNQNDPCQPDPCNNNCGC
jgi:hypothetical protein